MTWRRDEITRLRTLFVDHGKTARAIAPLLGRSVGAVQSQLGRMGLRRANSDERCWSAEDTAQLARLDAQGLPVQEIAARMGRSMHAITAKRMHLRRAAGETSADAAHARALAERDRRLSLPPRSLTAHLMGDPEPGRSALDQRGGHA